MAQKYNRGQDWTISTSTGGDLDLFNGPKVWLVPGESRPFQWPKSLMEDKIEQSRLVPLGWGGGAGGGEGI